MTTNKPMNTKSRLSSKILRFSTLLRNCESEIRTEIMPNPKIHRAANLDALTGSNEKGVIAKEVIPAPHKINELNCDLLFILEILPTFSHIKPKGGPS